MSNLEEITEWVIKFAIFGYLHFNHIRLYSDSVLHS